MKLIILLSLISTSLWGKPLVLIGHFDAFGKAAFNNSEKIAQTLAEKFAREDSPVTIKICKMNTIFDKAYVQIEICLKELPEAPTLVLGLGESTCDLKVETIMRNLDKTVAPDNAGLERISATIIPEGPANLGLRYPLPHMYCALPASERSSLDISNDAGSFVCNNTAYQLSYHYPEFQIGFIHVPRHDCRNLAKKTQAAVAKLEKMIIGGVDFLQQQLFVPISLPHISNEIRLPTTKDELKKLREEYKKDKCLSDFLKEAHGVDEKRGLWSLLNSKSSHSYKAHLSN